MIKSPIRFGFWPFLWFAAGLLAALMMGVVAWIVDDVTARHSAGDAATWFGAVATTAVAWLAYRTARDAARTAQASLANDLQSEARTVSYWLVPKLFGQGEALPSGAVRLPPPIDPGSSSNSVPAASSTWGEASSTDTAGLDFESPLGDLDFRIVILIKNAASRPMLNCLLQLAGDEGPRNIGKLRPGENYYWVQRTVREWGSPKGPDAFLRHLEFDRGITLHMDFTDSHERRWRIWSDGRITPR